MNDFKDYPDDRTASPAYRTEDRPPDYLKWIFGGIVGTLFVALLAFAFTNERAASPGAQQSASKPGATTTGSGATTRSETTGSGSVNREPPPIADAPRRQ